MARNKYRIANGDFDLSSRKNEPDHRSVSWYSRRDMKVSRLNLYEGRQPLAVDVTEKEQEEENMFPTPVRIVLRKKWSCGDKSRKKLLPAC